MAGSLEMARNKHTTDGVRVNDLIAHENGQFLLHRHDNGFQNKDQGVVGQKAEIVCSTEHVIEVSFLLLGTYAHATSCPKPFLSTIRTHEYIGSTREREREGKIRKPRTTAIS
jgi:hypothetical protein